MLIIDPNLHNPVINGVELIVNNRINPQLALAAEDIYGENGVVIEKFQDGTIRISADIDTISGGEYRKFLTIKDIDFMNNLPSTVYKFLNSLFSGIDENIFYVKDFSVKRDTTLFRTSPAYRFDIDGNPEGFENV